MPTGRSKIIRRDNISVFHKNIDTINRNTDALLETSKKVGLEVIKGGLYSGNISAVQFRNFVLHVVSEQPINFTKPLTATLCS
jgi:hypothetical protein